MTDPAARLPKAIDLAIQALTYYRRAKYATGEDAYRRGIKADQMTGMITGAPFSWVEEEHNHYMECSRALQELEDLKEILSDPGVTIDEEKQEQPL
jgi:hypothetical protein